MERRSLGLELSENKYIIEAMSGINGVRALYKNEMVYQSIPEDAAVGWDSTIDLTLKAAQPGQSSVPFKSG